MRQVLAMKPFASAMRYGPSFFGNLKNLVLSPQGTKHLASALGPETTSGPAAMAEKVKTEDSSTAAAMLFFRRVSVRYIGILPRTVLMFFSWSNAEGLLCSLSPATVQRAFARARFPP